MGENISNIEESLLLPKASIREEKVEAEALSSCTAGGWESFIGEVKKLGKIAAPMVAVTLSQNSLQFISVMMVGHLGELALSSTALAISLSSVTGFSVLVSSIYIYIYM